MHLFSAVLTGSAEVVTVSIPQNWLFSLAAAFGLAILTALLGWARPYVWAHFGAVRRIRRAERAVEEASRGIWLASSMKSKPPTDYARMISTSKPIIVVANLKGGVGKTTTVANLIGHYGLGKGKRVLAIDMDFQGSLSAIVLSQGDYDHSLQQQADGSPSKAAQLVLGRDAQWLRDTSSEIEGVPKGRCVPSYYTLSIAENRAMIEWVIGKRKDDIRYTLANVLHQPLIQDHFDIILIDAPPRLTTGCVQALCAATHVLIPTVLDGLSAEASGGFVDQLSTNQQLWPHLKLLGVFGNMTNSLTAESDGIPIDGRLAEYEADARTLASDSIRVALESSALPLRDAQANAVFPVQCFIPQKAELGNAAGNRIGYRKAGGGLPTQQLSRAYDRLGDEIDRRILASTKR
jgi:cellulose biosynthesis protein BcsQ